jgi:hypothetical protein
MEGTEAEGMPRYPDLDSVMKKNRPWCLSGYEYPGPI